MTMLVGKKLPNNNHPVHHNERCSMVISVHGWKTADLVKIPAWLAPTVRAERRRMRSLRRWRMTTATLLRVIIYATTTAVRAVRAQPSVPNLIDGRGFPVQCADKAWSLSGGLQGACSHHGGINRRGPGRPYARAMSG